MFHVYVCVLDYYSINFFSVLLIKVISENNETNIEQGDPFSSVNPQRLAVTRRASPHEMYNKSSLFY